MDEIAVLIPCFNEEITVGKVVRDFKKTLPQATVYVYDNNSTDKTVEKAKEAGAIVRHEYQQGKGNVVRRMFQEVEAQCYILVDADDTYPASEAAKMTERVLKYQCFVTAFDGYHVIGQFRSAQLVQGDVQNLSLFAHLGTYQNQCTAAKFPPLAHPAHADG